MNWLAILKIALPYLIVAIIAGGIVGKIQQSRIDSVKADLKVAQKDLTDCQGANAIDVKTIGQLRGEVKKANSTCAKTIRDRERAITKLQNIDSLEGNDANTGTDTLLDTLNRVQ